MVVAGDADDARRGQTGGCRRFGGHSPEALTARADLGEDRGRQRQLTDQVFGPAARMKIERQRARGERQAPREVMGDVQPDFRARQSLRLIVLEPQQLAQREGRIRGQAGQRVQALLADLRREAGELSDRPLVVPGDHGTGRPPFPIERDEGLADAGDRDAANAAGALDTPRRVGKRPACRPPQGFGVVLGPTGTRPRDHCRPAALGDHLSVRREHQCPDARRAGVDPGDQPVIVHGRTENCVPVDPRRRDRGGRGPRGSSWCSSATT